MKEKYRLCSRIGCFGECLLSEKLRHKGPQNVCFLRNIIRLTESVIMICMDMYNPLGRRQGHVKCSKKGVTAGHIGLKMWIRLK